MTMYHKKVLLDHCYPINDLESEHAEKMFTLFIQKGFSYDILSNNPDFLVYPSSYTLSIVFPILIDVMIKRNDVMNFLIYGILTTIDPEGNGSATLSDRCHNLKKIFSKDVVSSICQLLKIIEDDPPIELPRLQRIKDYWGC